MFLEILDVSAQQKQTINLGSQQSMKLVVLSTSYPVFYSLFNIIARLLCFYTSLVAAVLD